MVLFQHHLKWTSSQASEIWTSVRTAAYALGLVCLQLCECCNSLLSVACLGWEQLAFITATIIAAGIAFLSFLGLQHKRANCNACQLCELDLTWHNQYKGLLASCVSTLCKFSGVGFKFTKQYTVFLWFNTGDYHIAGFWQPACWANHVHLDLSSDVYKAMSMTWYLAVSLIWT